MCFPEKPEFQVGPQRGEGRKEFGDPCSSLGEPGTQILKSCAVRVGQKLLRPKESEGTWDPHPTSLLTSCTEPCSPPPPAKQGRPTQDQSPSPRDVGAWSWREGTLPGVAQGSSASLGRLRRGRTVASWLKGASVTGTGMGQARWERTPKTPGRGVARGPRGPCGLKDCISQEGLQKG